MEGTAAYLLAEAALGGDTEALVQLQQAAVALIETPDVGELAALRGSIARGRDRAAQNAVEVVPEHEQALIEIRDRLEEASIKELVRHSALEREQRRQQAHKALPQLLADAGKPLTAQEIRIALREDPAVTSRALHDALEDGSVRLAATEPNRYSLPL